ncbi:DUF302 domain-containing protein [Thiomicrorhabdus cannonii]|uniref:DUF302 domain-containing protein n=1 Tax=Thiomicrorhabdus cannonii TaxID=2748011 RepID=UPI0015BB96F3|nr:DUF302 domain-containing protein [Thiomicrorhabdus cannonii]
MSEYQAETVSDKGLVKIPSLNSVKRSVDKLEAEVTAHGMKVFARIDHAAGALQVDKQLRPTELLIFGSPQGGTPLMAASQAIGLDLPLKILAWEDESGMVWLSYNDLAYLANRYGISECPQVEVLSAVLSGLVNIAAEH